ncbi:MAG TPA: glycosyltransferase family 4 protein [bacterium]|nr:glycosyltransferase family 4 protein [bacterium]
MRILYLCADPGVPYWGTKGASIHVRAFARALVAAGQEVTVVIARAGKPHGTLPEGVRVVEIPAESEQFFAPRPDSAADEATLLYEARQFSQNRAAQDVMNDLLAHERYDIICERYSLFSVAGRESARWHDLPFVLEVNAPLAREAKEHRQLILEPLALAIERYLYASADQVVTVSAALATHVSRIAPAASVSVIPNGVDVDAFESVASASDWRESRGLTRNGDFCIGFIGSLKPWHGLDILMDAFAQLEPSRSRYRLLLIGDGPLRPALEREVQERNLAAQVVMTGAIPHEEIPSATQACDVLVAPYPSMENFYFSPLKVYEYMAAGRPIVASRIGQIASILTHEENALLSEPGKALPLARAIERLRGDSDLAGRLAQRARHDAFTSHSWRRRMVDWIAMFNQLSETRMREESGA